MPARPEDVARKAVEILAPWEDPDAALLRAAKALDPWAWLDSFTAAARALDAGEPDRRAALRRLAERPAAPAPAPAALPPARPGPIDGVPKAVRDRLAGIYGGARADEILRAGRGEKPSPPPALADSVPPVSALQND